ncbi:hypothetical protein JN11_00287 [Mucilaginibacter frigoritolerans]|uniref:Uncharacterized protein n=1 Tax=Mucilaginibacter frigoritolerans TaxID=652788 RepID=A0A562UHB9_9SPHI|nr:hypothetical protein [Mucilaginibacter frigoritolerans]TWJ04575.1 hypothetical protein JN11_00287 [Mucilaginibacter frigoritolerans]
MYLAVGYTNKVSKNNIHLQQKGVVFFMLIGLALNSLSACSGLHLTGRTDKKLTKEV